MKPSYLITKKSASVTFTVGGKFKTKTATVGTKEYDAIVAAIKENRVDDLDKIVDGPEQAISEVAKFSEDFIQVDDGIVTIDGEETPVELGERLVAYAAQGLDYKILVNFFRSLIQNPSRNSYRSLFRFLAANHFPLTEDGCFLAYKKVDSNYKDLRTRTFDNSPGQVVRVRRNEVDENIHTACSHGLHVACFEYASKFYGHSESKLIVVKVHPKDVVAVPIGEQDQKMRVCEYRVVGDIGEEMKEAVVVNETLESWNDDDDALWSCDDDDDEYDNI